MVVTTAILCRRTINSGILRRATDEIHPDHRERSKIEAVINVSNEVQITIEGEIVEEAAEQAGKSA